MRFPLNLLGQALRYLQDARVSAERLSGFFLLPIRQDLSQAQDAHEEHPFIAFNGASFAWNAGNVADATASSSSSHEEPSTPSTAIEAAYSQVPTSDESHAEAEATVEMSKSKPFRLNELNLRFGRYSAAREKEKGGNKSSLVAFLGSVGSGKSSLLQAILGEIPQCRDDCGAKVEPKVTVSGRLVYCSQQPWIQNMTLRDNVLFGYEFSDADPTIQADYKRSIAAAALMPDIEILRQGDLTEIGERGVNLSGGQKARVAIARAFFISLRRANICLLDDPFSAVDGDTGTAIFHNGLRGLLRGTTDKERITVVCLNSHLHLLPFFDRVVMLDEGVVVADAAPADLATGPQAVQLARATGISEEVMLSLVEAAAARSNTPPIPPLPLPSAGQVSKNGELNESNVVLAVAVAVAVADAAEQAKGTESASLSSALMSETEMLADGKIIIGEKRVFGAVKLSVYLDYFYSALWPLRVLSNDNIFTDADGGVSGTGMKNYRTKQTTKDSNYAYFIGLLIGAGLILLFMVAQAARIGVDYALARWAGDALGDPHSDWATVFYASFGVLALFVTIRTLYLNYWTWKSARAVHEATFHSILQAPVTEFFDTHTVGEVLNKLSRDTEVMDSAVPEFLLQFCVYFMQVTFTFGICVWSSPYISIGFIPMCYGFVRAGQLFSCVTRDLKRMESMSHSPIFSSLSETLTGLDTIRAYGDSNRFLKDHRKKTDLNGTYYFHLWMCSSWMTFRLEMATAMLLVTVAVFAVFLRETTDPVALGLALSYGLQLNSVFQRCVQLAIEVGVYMTSVERVIEYITLPQEQSVLPRPETDAADENGVEFVPMGASADVSKDPLSVHDVYWPEIGTIEFRNVTFAYRNNPPALRNLSFSIKGGERVGVCGRTGAGKSSILFALFRMAGIADGSIFVGGRNVTYDVPLSLLRQKMAIIPQDPVLLTGTIRFALDPFGDYTDQQVLEALDTVNMAAAIRNLPKGLSEPVLEGGSNLSHGQRQLICIARALLRDARILVVDEGTSAVDPATDNLIQDALKNASKKRGTTVLAIAHRLKTIQDFDRILVMGEGQLLEYDTPEVLLANKSSQFYSMLQETSEKAEENNYGEG